MPGQPFMQLTTVLLILAASTAFSCNPEGPTGRRAQEDKEHQILADPLVGQDVGGEAQANEGNAVGPCKGPRCSPIDEQKVFRGARNVMDAFGAKMTKGPLSPEDTQIARRLCKEFGERLARQHFCTQVGNR